MKARVWIAQGRPSEAADWARDRGVSTTDDASYLSEFDHLTLVRLILAQRGNRDSGALDQAAGLLDRLAGAAETSGRAGSLLEIRLRAALAHHAQGHRAQALQSLAQAWARAPEPDGYVRLFLDEGASMVELLRAERASRATGYRGRSDARRLLSLAQLAKPKRPTRGNAGRPVGRAVERAGTAGAQAARQRADRAADRPRAVRLAQHAAHPHQAHLHQARRHQPPGGGPPRPRTRPDVAVRGVRSHPVSHIVG